MKLQKPVAAIMAHGACLLPLLLTMSACPVPTCVGAGCSEIYSAARLGVFQGRHGGWQGELDPLDDLQEAILGQSRDGNEWSLAPADHAVFVGMPDAGIVRWYITQDLTSLSTSSSYRALFTHDDPQSGFGASLSTLRDWPETGTTSLLVGAPRARGQDSALEAGKVFLFADVDWPDGQRISTSEAYYSLSGLHAYDQAGTRVEACSDLDGDGLGDFLVNVPWDQQTGGSLSGSVVVVLSTRLSQEPAGTEIALDLAGPRFWSGQAGARVGASASCQHDLGSDGKVDLVIGAPFADDRELGREAAGAIYILDGQRVIEEGAGGDLELLSGTVLRGLHSEVYLGSSFDVGDIDQDGRVDLVAGAPGTNSGGGKVYIYTSIGMRAAVPRPVVQLGGSEDEDRFGTSLHLADLSGDGLPDLLAGAPMHNPSEQRADFSSGALYFWLNAGDIDSWAQASDLSEATAIFTRAQGYLRTGLDLATHDINQDGTDDLLLVNQVKPD